MASRYENGTTVHVMGLRSKREFNGKFARIVRFVPEKGRYIVNIFGEHKPVSLKPGNVDKTNMQFSDEGLDRYGLDFTIKEENGQVRVFYDGSQPGGVLVPGAKKFKCKNPNCQEDFWNKSFRTFMKGFKKTTKMSFQSLFEDDVNAELVIKLNGEEWTKQKPKKCPNCKKATYCTDDCLYADMVNHKTECH